jgi:hypothetical protein
MTGILFSIVTLLGIILAINLLLTFALIRRVAWLSSGRSAVLRPPAVGTAVKKFAVVTDTGTQFGLDTLRSGRFTVIFMMTGCAPCHRLLTDLSSRPILNGAQILAFIGHHGDSNDDAVAEYRRMMPAGIQVAVTDPAGDVPRAFAIQNFPTTLRVDYGVVSAAGHSLDAALDPAAASPVTAPSVAA